MTRKILFVCLGNICRSPTAEGVFRHFANQQSKLGQLEIDSCGTSAHHLGESPDPRSVRAAKARGYDLSSIRSRKITLSDFAVFDYILAMDNQNLQQIERLAEQASKDIIDGSRAKVSLFLDYDSESSQREVPDPYYGGSQGFDQVIDLIEGASRGLINDLL